jgi:hypothetical protein
MAPYPAHVAELNDCPLSVTAGLPALFPLNPVLEAPPHCPNMLAYVSPTPSARAKVC